MFVTHARLPGSLSSRTARRIMLPVLAAWLALGFTWRLAVAQPPQAPMVGPSVPAPQAGTPQAGKVQLVDNSDMIRPIRSAQERLNMTVNGSVILVLEKNIPRVQVDNPELLTITPLSAKQVQLHAKKAGPTKVTLWDEDSRIYTVDVVVYGDTRELTDLLSAEFPSAKITVRPTQAGVVLGGFVDRADDVNRIVTMAQDYYPKVINNLYVGGVPQVILHVKVMEVSRTKLRDIGVDFNEVFSQGSSFFSSTAGGLSKVATLPQVVSPYPTVTSPLTTVINQASVTQPTVALGVLNQFNNGFYGFIQFLQRNNLLKVLAEPTLVTTSGRPAYFLSGGEMPIPVPQSLGTVSIQFRKFGTQVDFVPIVLSGGRIHLEVRPKISEIDPTVSITLNGSTIPGFRTRECDTGVEMNAGQTLAIAGLIQTDVDAQLQGLPYLMDIPYLGVLFRRNTETIEETELLITIRPELSDAMNCEQVPPIAPGMNTMQPDNCGFYWKGYFEVPSPPVPGPGGPVGLNGIGPNGPYPPGGPGAPPPGTYPGYPPPNVYPAGALPPGAVPDTMEEIPGQPVSKKTDNSSAKAGSGGKKPDNSAAGTVARRPASPRTAANPFTPSNPNNRSQPQGQTGPATVNVSDDPPMFIGPTGYDVNK